MIVIFPFQLPYTTSHCIFTGLRHLLKMYEAIEWVYLYSASKMRLFRKTVNTEEAWGWGGGGGGEGE